MFELSDGGDTLASQLLRLGREPSLWQHLSRAGLRNAAMHTSQRQALELHRLLSHPLP